MSKPTESNTGASAEDAAKAHRVLWLKIWGPSIVIVLLGFAVAYRFVEPAPPSEIRIATGPSDGAYARFAEQYREELAKARIHLVPVETAGSIENLALLDNNEADAAFVQGGTLPPGGAENLVALGTVYLEPLWIFYRGGPGLERLSELRGMRIATGVEGSGTRALALGLLEDNGLSGGDAEYRPLGGRAAVDALKAGDIDAAFFVIDPGAALIRELLEAPDIALMPIRRHLAYRSHYSHLTSVVLGEGVIDLDRNLSRREVTLVAPAAMLVARHDFHPALVVLMLQAASKIHEGNSLFENAGPFPTPRYVDAELTLSQDAQRYYELGPSILQRYLPFWAATLIDRLKIMLLPLVTLLLPLVKLGPPIYVWRTRVKIYRWYRVLREIDQHQAGSAARKARRNDLTQLGKLEKELNAITVPLSYMAEFYNLRLHIEHVRRKLERP